MRLIPIAYKTAHFGRPAGGGSARPYTMDRLGYAIELPAPMQWLHLCVRRLGSTWVVDHFESGYLIAGLSGYTRSQAVLLARAWQPSAVALKQMRRFVRVPKGA